MQQCTVRPSGIVRLLTALAVLAFAAACAKAPEADRELGWARAAIDRNEALEVVAVDRDARVFTVRRRDGGQLYTVSVDELVAGPAALMTAPESAASASEPVSGDAATVASTPTDAARSAVAAPVAESAAAPASPQASALDATALDASETAQSAYTIERSDGRVRVSGPGFSIMSAESAANEIELAAARAPARDQPIICEGRRMMHIDGRTLDVEGDAVIARGGCDLHITNSRITATGVAVSATSAKVHVTNSTLEGGLRSLEISAGGKAYLRASTLDGVVQRLGDAEMHDLGGNEWQ